MMTPPMLRGIILAACWMGAPASFLGRAQAEIVLFDFGPGFDFSRVATTDAQVSPSPSETGQALRVAAGHEKPWPGITLSAPANHWDLSAFDHLTLRVRNTGRRRTTIYCRVDNPGADGVRHCVTGSLGLDPGQAGAVRVPLIRSGPAQLNGTLFGMRGYPVAPGGPGTVDPRNITQLVIFLNRPAQDHQFDIETIRASGSYTPPTAWVTDADPYLPFIDAFGQYRHKDWPGKVHSVEELRTRQEQETKQLQGEPPRQDWCGYGGWTAGPRLEATGFFRTEKQAGKWWLVDPDGHLFWSHGVDCVRLLDTTPVEEREDWFENFPGTGPDLKEFLSRSYVLKGHYAGRTPRCFSFAAANIKRKYGPNWREAYGEMAHRRMRSWGLNTIGNWSDQSVRLLRRTPYTDNLGSRRAKMIEGSEGYWGKFPDVYDPSFAESLRRSMGEKAGSSAGDPWCIGYFSDNEIAWGDEVSLAVAALKSPEDQAAKRVFVSDLQDRYRDITALNQAWGTAHASWGALLESRTAPDRNKAWNDLTAFYFKCAEHYFRTVRDIIKAVAPHQLYLGCRFAWVNDLAAKAAAPYCDVVSYNLYRRTVADFKYPGGDKPLLIGEFHFGALDRGMFHTGLVPVADQEARAAAYREYVLGAVCHPQFVGAHWFQWQDEPTTGRVFDEENYQIGFVTVADTPYPETIEACRHVADRMYRARVAAP